MARPARRTSGRQIFRSAAALGRRRCGTVGRSARNESKLQPPGLISVTTPGCRRGARHPLQRRGVARRGRGVDRRGRRVARRGRGRRERVVHRRRRMRRAEGVDWRSRSRIVRGNRRRRRVSRRDRLWDTRTRRCGNGCGRARGDKRARRRRRVDGGRVADGGRVPVERVHQLVPCLVANVPSHGQACRSRGRQGLKGNHRRP